MALQKQTFTLSLAGGVDLKTDDKQVLPSKLLTLENGVFISPKEIQKRNGYQPLELSIQNNFSFILFNAVPTALIQGNFISTFNEEITLNDDLNLFSYSIGLQQWIYKGQNTICELATMPVVTNVYNQTIPDSAINTRNGIQVFAWEDSSTGNCKLSIIDSDTGQVIVNSRDIPPTGGGTTIKPKCASIGNYLVVFYLDTTTAMHLSYIAYANGTFSSPVVLATDVKVTTNQNHYDIAVFNNQLYVTYNTSLGGGSIATTFLTPNLVQGTSQIQIGENANNALTVFGDLNNNVWIGYANSALVRAYILNAALVIQRGPTTISAASNVYNITGVGNSGFATFFWDILGSADSEGAFSNAQVFRGNLPVIGGPSGLQVFINSAALQSKAFNVLSNNTYIPHVVVTHDSVLQPTYFLCNLYNVTSAATSFNVVSKIAPSLGGGIPTRHSLAQVNTVGDYIFQTALLKKDLLFTSSSSTGTVNTYTRTGVISASFDFTKTNLSNVTLGQNLHISSGMISMYDGSNVVEHGFHLYPEAITVTMNGSGGSLSAGVYGYQFLYTWTDNQGQVHRSSPSPVISKTAVATDSATIVIPTLRITAKQNVNIVVYRTQVNGTVYYRLNSPNSPLANSLTANTVTYTDTASDASIAANEQLYTTGGEVVNIAAPASSAMCTYKNRIILIPSENPSSWWFSKQVIPGSPVEFSNVFVENVGTADGEIVIPIQMDSNLIFFKNNSIWYVTGDGPSASGANNDFSEALSIASDVGCINAQSLVLTPMGLMFKSHKGIYLLNRGFTLQYIGADVEAYNQYNVTSAQLITNTNQIRFTLSNGVALMYDYFMSQWSVFTGIDAFSTVILDNNYTYLQANGLVLQETPGTFTDNGNFIKLKIVTSWLSLAGVQGYQRIYKALILGKYFGPHQLKAQFAYDFNPISVQEDYINVTQLINSNVYGNDYTFGLTSPFGGEFPYYQWRLFTEKQVCQAIQITLEDIPNAGTYVNNQGTLTQTGYNESMSLSAITLELGIKKGLVKLPSSSSFG